jgi:hypothetical protein
VSAVAQCNQVWGTIGQRLDRLFEQQERVTVEDLLTVVQSHGDLNSNAFGWAVHKLVWRLDSSSPEYRDLRDFVRGAGRYRSVLSATMFCC